MNIFEQELDAVIKDCEKFIGETAPAHHNYGAGALGLETACLAAIERASGTRSIYMSQAIVAKDSQFDSLEKMVSVCKVLLTAIRGGYQRIFEEVIHADVFSDYLEMAEHLCESGYKDAAAVIAGSTLEAHLRQLCAKFNVSTMNNGKPIKADTLNSDLVKAGAYDKLDNKNVTSWQGLRNKAAHGEYSAYDKTQVILLISAIRDFITRRPA